MVKKYINDCYVIGTTLLYLDEVSFERLTRIKANLLIRNIKTDLTMDSIKKTVLEWHDFFEFTDDNKISLTEQASQNKLLVEIVFNSCLSFETGQSLSESILNYPKSKIIQFPTKQLKQI